MSESNASIPIMRKPVDEMSTGLNSSNLAASAMQRHPIDRMQRGELLKLELYILMLWIGIDWRSYTGYFIISTVHYVMVFYMLMFLWALHVY